MIIEKPINVPQFGTVFGNDLSQKFSLDRVEGIGEVGVQDAMANIGVCDMLIGSQNDRLNTASYIDPKLVRSKPTGPIGSEGSLAGNSHEAITNGNWSDFARFILV